MSIRTLKQTFKQKKIYIMLLCKYMVDYSFVPAPIVPLLPSFPCSRRSPAPVVPLLLSFPCSCRSPAPVVPVCPTTTPPLDILFTTSQMFPVAPNHCHSPSPSSFHPRTTPRAVAREAGGGWCAIHHCRRGMASRLGFSILKKENPRLAVSEMAGGKGWYPRPATLHEQGLVAVVGVDQGAPAVVVNSKITI